jgi:hypothetical protein
VAARAANRGGRLVARAARRTRPDRGRAAAGGGRGLGAAPRTHWRRGGPAGRRQPLPRAASADRRLRLPLRLALQRARASALAEARQPLGRRRGNAALPGGAARDRRDPAAGPPELRWRRRADRRRVVRRWRVDLGPVRRDARGRPCPAAEPGHERPSAESLDGAPSAARVRGLRAVPRAGRRRAAGAPRRRGRMGGGCPALAAQWLAGPLGRARGRDVVGIRGLHLRPVLALGPSPDQRLRRLVPGERRAARASSLPRPAPVCPERAAARWRDRDRLPHLDGDHPECRPRLLASLHRSGLTGAHARRCRPARGRHPGRIRVQLAAAETRQAAAGGRADGAHDRRDAGLCCRSCGRRRLPDSGVAGCLAGLAAAGEPAAVLRDPDSMDPRGRARGAARRLRPVGCRPVRRQYMARADREPAGAGRRSLFPANCKPCSALVGDRWRHGPRPCGRHMASAVRPPVHWHRPHLVLDGRDLSHARFSWG